MNLLVTGGAGYIGAHTLVELLSEEFEVHVVDNFFTGSKEALKRVQEITKRECKYTKLDIRCEKELSKVFSKIKPDAVMHFAGLKNISDSIKNPILYFENNVSGTLALLKVMDQHHCKNIIFSSSATVYGNPQYLPIDEIHPLNPITPYGRSKLMVEEILRCWVRDGSKKACALRYFNPIGAHSSSIIGEYHIGSPNNLLPYLTKVVLGEEESLKIFGGDYETSDGTGERDYIHVTDLATAHVSAIKNIKTLDKFEALNVGTGKPTSVKEVIKLTSNIVGYDVPFQIVSKREGDVPVSFANPTKINEKLGWQSSYDVLEGIKSSLIWQTNNPKGYLA